MKIPERLIMITRLVRYARDIGKASTESGITSLTLMTPRATMYITDPITSWEVTVRDKESYSEGSEMQYYGVAEGLRAVCLCGREGVKRIRDVQTMPRPNRKTTDITTDDMARFDELIRDTYEILVR